MLGIQYAVQICVYLVIVVIILRRAHVSHEIGTNVLCDALMAIVIGTALQALPNGPVGFRFVVDMRCADISAVQIAPRSRALVGGETDKQESAAWVGLQNYLVSV